MVHGAYKDEDEYVFAPAQALDSLLDAPAQVTFFGHTHLQGGFTLHNDQVGALHFKPTDEKHFSTLTIEEGTTYLLNPGSVGQPRDGDTRAAFVIADLQNKSVEFWRVPYDIESVQKRMGPEGFPSRSSCASLLAVKATGNSPWNPEKSSYSKERRRFPLAFALGILVVAIIFGGFVLLTRHMRSPAQASAVKLPFGPVELAYAERIHFTGLQMARATNFLKQEFTYVSRHHLQRRRAKHWRNASGRGISRRLESGDFARTEVLIAPHSDPLPAGQRRDFQITLEHIPAEWNHQYPSIHVTGLILQ